MNAISPPMPPSLWAATAPPAPPTVPFAGDARTGVVVVGGGFTGLSAALHLAEAGVPVTVLEAAEIGWGASGRNNGQVIPTLSRLDPDQIVAAVVSLGIFGLLWAIDSLATLLPHPADNWLLALSLLGRFTPFALGAMYVSDFGFFVVTILLGLFLAQRALARR